MAETNSKVEKSTKWIPPNAGKGRVKGTPNKVTTEFREAVNNLLNFAAPEMIGWLSRVADGMPEHGIKPNPEKALDSLSKLAEYAAPKLARTEIAGDKDAPFRTIIEWQT